MSAAEVARQVGCSSFTLYRHILADAPPLPRAGCQPPPDDTALSEVAMVWHRRGSVRVGRRTLPSSVLGALRRGAPLGRCSDYLSIARDRRFGYFGDADLPMQRAGKSRRT